MEHSVPNDNDQTSKHISSAAETSDATDTGAEATDVKVDTKKDINCEFVQNHAAVQSQSSIMCGEYSSDDESLAKNVNGNGSLKSGSPAADEVSSISDFELCTKLRSFGLNVGPVVGSTRQLYEKKLLGLLSGGRQSTSPAIVSPPPVPPASTALAPPAAGYLPPPLPNRPPAPAAAATPEPAVQPAVATLFTLQPAPASAPPTLEDFSDGEELDVQEHPPPKSANGALRQRFAGDATMPDLSGLDLNSPALRPVFLKDETDQPSPRRSVRELNGGTVVERAICNSVPTDALYEEELRPWVRHAVKLSVVIVLAAIFVYCYYNLDDCPTLRLLWNTLHSSLDSRQTVADSRPVAEPLVAPPVAAADN